ncbi:uncharacterized protein [Argopecten irradians]|uniref:uncharacterized protein n=1 Tax=Argopecten irradians TaxID=31199 RepID=UPI0037240B12
MVIMNLNSDTASVHISSYGGHLGNVTIQSNGVHTERFSSDFEVLNSGLSRKGIKVISDQHLSIYGISKHRNGFEGFFSIPTSLQGNHYFVTTGTSSSEILVVGIYQDTCVFVILNSNNTRVLYNGNSYSNGSIIKENLNEHSTMQIYSEGDLSGVEIEASKTVSVFSGNRVSGPYAGRNHMLEQIPPINQWTKEYVTAPPKGYSYDCQIMSGYPDTYVNYTCSENGEESTSLPEAGSFITLTFGDSVCSLISNKPIMVTMIVEKVDRPCLITVIGLVKMTGGTTVYVPPSIIDAQLVIVSNGSITVDPVDTSESTHIICPSYINGCVTYVDNLRNEQKYIISSPEQNYLISSFFHGRGSSRRRKIGYPIQHFNIEMEQTMREDSDVECVESTTDDPELPRTCQCCSSNNYTTDELDNILQQLRNELYVQPTKTVRYTRSLISAPDHRVSSKVIGYTCGCVIGCLGLCLLVFDRDNILTMMKTIRENLSYKKL